MAGKFELKTASNGKFHFNLKAGNGEVILSSQMYATRAGAEGGIASVKKNAALDAQFERLTSEKGQPYFVLKAGNGEVIGRSEMYSSNSSMEKGIKSVMANAPTAEIKDLTEKKTDAA